MRGHPYQPCTASTNRHAGFVQTYEFKSVNCGNEGGVAVTRYWKSAAIDYKKIPNSRLWI